MSGKGKKYTFWLHPGDLEHVICIGKLDGILDQINKGEVKKGTLSKEIAKALHKYFSSHVEDSQSLRVSAKCSRITIPQAVIPQPESNEGQFVEAESPSQSEPASASTESDNIKNSLINLTMSL